MARVRQTGIPGLALLRLAAGIFFLVLGITGVLPESEGMFSLSRDRTALEVIFGAVEILCGLFLVLDSFRAVPRKTSITVLLVILCVWTLRIVLTQFVNGIDLTSKGMLFHPTFWTWVFNLSTYLLVAVVLWVLYRAE